MSVKVTVDQSVNAAYIEFSDHEVVRTVRVGGGINVDLDDMNVVVGIEVLSIHAELPVARLADEFHVHSDVIGLLYTLRPSVGSQLARFSQQSEGVSERKPVLAPI